MASAFAPFFDGITFVASALVAFFDVGDGRRSIGARRRSPPSPRPTEAGVDERIDEERDSEAPPAAGAGVIARGVDVDGVESESVGQRFFMKRACGAGSSVYLQHKKKAHERAHV
jgi:hypothetical protein